MNPRAATKLLHRIAHGGLGVAAALLLPRAASLTSQWLLSGVAGPSAVTAYVLTTSHASTIVSLVAVGLASALTHRARLLGAARGRALVAGALAVLGAVAGALTLAVDLALGLGPVAALSAALFAFPTLLACANPVAWPVWQARGRFLALLSVTAVISVGLCFGAALLGMPRLSAVLVGAGVAVPVLAMLGRVQLRRAARYAVLLVRSSVPPSIVNLSTVAIYPLALYQGIPLLGEAKVGTQALCWSIVPLLSTTSQSFASRALTAAALDKRGAEAERRAQALSAWARTVPFTLAVGVAIYLLFVVRVPLLPFTGGAREALPPTFLVSVSVPAISDPLCFFFARSHGGRGLVLGSVLSSLLLAVVLLVWPAGFLDRFGVLGASGLIAVLRMLFLLDVPLLRRITLAALGLLFLGYAVSLLL
ncbi:hypothetical protein WMF31_01365 [Sorangium sp. So ce1036]|uniref:hypothetical protein n=1 Tax=Sorangium sp. So ce1036 TaxID=3133328 RepID=UPI003F03A80F